MIIELNLTDRLECLLTDTAELDSFGPNPSSSIPFNKHTHRFKATMWFVAGIAGIIDLVVESIQTIAWITRVIYLCRVLASRYVKIKVLLLVIKMRKF